LPLDWPGNELSADRLRLREPIDDDTVGVLRDSVPFGSVNQVTVRRSRRQ